jgi:hypothetical protein
MGRLSTAMLAELQKATPEVFPLFSFTVGATTYRYASIGAIQSSVGLYEPRVLWWGTITRGVTLRQNAVEFATLELAIDDTDQTFTKLVEGSARHSVRGAACSCVLASPNVSSADWFTGYSGRIDSYQQTSPLAWTIAASPNDLPLQRESVPKWRVNSSDWPSSALDVRDLDVPILYGTVSSANVTNDGAISCLYVDQSGYRYLVCAGRAKSVDTVYKDGVAQAASNYAITYPLVNGRRCTLIDFTSSQGTSSITCDARGYETVGDGTGTLITDPPTILKHLLVNWIYGDYKDGAWFADSTAPVDTTSFGTTYFSDRSVQASLYLDKKRRGQDVVNDFLKSFEARAYWLSNGKVAFAVEDFTLWAYPTTVLRQDETDGWGLSYSPANLVDRVEAKWSNVNGGYQQVLRVADLRTGEVAPESLELPYSAAFLV